MFVNKLNISTKINIVVTGCLSVFLLIPCLYFVEVIVERTQSNIEISNTYVTKLASEIYLHPLLDNNFATIMSLTLGFIQDERIVKVVVYNAKGVNVIPLGQNSDIESMTTREYRQVISIRAGSKDKGVPIGEVAITFDMTKHYQEVKRIRQVLFSLIAITMAITIILIAHFLRRFIKKPIVELSHSVSQVMTGDLKQKAKIIAKDEIGELALLFNQMTGHLDTVSQELTNSRQVAEDALDDMIVTQQQLVQSEKMVSLGTLTAGVAHEINNPTNFIHVSVQNLTVDLARFQQFVLDLAGDEADEEILDSFRQQFSLLYEHLNIIKDGTQRIKTIVTDLRTFSQLDNADHSTVAITNGLQSTINLVRTKNKAIAIFVTEFESHPQLLCYPAQLNQVFMNLIVNACDAIRDKLRQHDSDKPGQVTVGCRTLGDAIEITIKDNGCGMSDETRNKLFEPFYTTKAVGEGTGLGLSISYGIVQKHGGELSVESEVGVGTVFTLRLAV
ncbi:MAG: HAMP domain-containing histidine kinase [Algicola sp.]|nr:HAMP domain-containing histidine kinase [Algicola sp.]